MSNPRVLVYDEENAPAIGLFFGRTYDVNIAKTIQHEYVFGFAWKWLGEKRIHSCYIWDFPLYKKEPTNSIEVIKKWSELVKEADILVGHNSDSFDYRQLHGRVVEYDLPPVPKPQSVDTKKLAKQLGYYQSNSLDDLVRRFGLGRKLPHNDYPNKIDLWWDCMNGKQKAKKHMVAYNKVDVEVTERLYLRFRPHVPNHPNIKQISGRPTDCAVSGCKDPGFWAEGVRHQKAASYQRWKCKKCWSYQPNSPEFKVAGRV